MTTTDTDIELAASGLTLDEFTELVRETEQRKGTTLPMNANDKKPDRPDSQPDAPDHPSGPPIRPADDPQPPPPGDPNSPGKGPGGG